MSSRSVERAHHTPPRFFRGPTFVVSLMVLAGAIPASAQDPSMVDRGRFEIVIGGSARGQESFAIRRQGEEYMAVGRTSLEGENLLVLSAEVGLRTDARFMPVRYEFRTLQRPTSTTIAVRSGNRIRVTTSNQEGERMTEVLADRGIVLIQTGVAHHYWFLIQRFGNAEVGRGGTVDALTPDDVKRSGIRLEAVEEVDLAFPAGPVVEARRHDVRIGDTRHTVWTEKSTGRVVRAEIPERAWVAVRLFEGDAANESPDGEPRTEDRP